jgi:glycosyl transferase family 2
MDRESGEVRAERGSISVGDRELNTLLAKSPQSISPVVRQTLDGVAAGLSVDHVVVDGDFLAVSGWAIGGHDLTFTVAGGAGVPMFPSLSFFPRDDVAAGYDVAPDLAKGFLAIWRNRPRGDMQVRLGAGTGQPLQIDLPAPEQCAPAELAQLLRENLARAGRMFEGLVHNPAAISVLVKHLEEPPPGFNRAKGHIEIARGIEGVGGLVVGWTVGEPDLSFRLVDEQGAVVPLTAAARWSRNDIIEAMSRDFGDYVFNAGFLQGWSGALRMGGSVRLIASTDEASYTLSEIKWSPAPVEPLSFARWAFEMPTPRETFAERLTVHDGAIINALIERKIARRPKSPPMIQEYGRQSARPKCAVIVPLHGRYDFMLNQLLAFSEDSGFLASAELVYVIDDHRIVSPLAFDAPIFSASFGVPFRTVWGGENRGFAGATNLGVANSSAPFILLLNSDVIPIASGWLEKMCSVLAGHPEIGMLGARLHHPSGAVQHDGMAFRWEPARQAYLNEHPGAGLPGSAASDKFVKRQAVTAACVLLRREVYQVVGGLDEKFLIGDFEDSDLCLKVREKGLEIACLPLPVTLIHLERQSLNAIGTPSFREYVAHYNSWRHQARWGATIAKLTGVDTEPATSK